MLGNSSGSVHKVSLQVKETPTLEFENFLWGKDIEFIAGLDEVGRGSWAGPVVVGAVILPRNFQIPEGLADSKLLKPNRRKKLAKIIKEQSLAYSISQVNLSVINKKGIGEATQKAFRLAIKSLKIKPQYTLIDAFYIKHLNKKVQKPIKNGDKICASISAASIIAKVYRDELMKKLHFKYPQYGFGRHKGYGTRAHQEAIAKYGFCPLHRKSFNLQWVLDAKR